MKVGGQGGGLGAEAEEAEEAEGRVVRESAEVGGGSEEVAAQEFRRVEGEVGVGAGGNGGRGMEGTEMRVPVGRDGGPKGAGIGALLVRGRARRTRGGRWKVCKRRKEPRRERLSRMASSRDPGGGPVRVGSADGEDRAGCSTGSPFNVCSNAQLLLLSPLLLPLPLPLPPPLQRAFPSTAS